MHTLRSEDIIFKYNSDLSGDILIYNSKTDQSMTLPGKDLINLVLGNAMEEIRSATYQLQAMITQAKESKAEIVPKVVEVFQLMQLIDTLDDEMMLLLYSGDTSITGLVFSDSLTEENIAYLKEKYGDHQIASIDTSSEGHLIILMD